MQLSLPDTPTSFLARDFVEFHRGFFAAASWSMRHRIVGVQCDDRLGHAYVEAVYHEPNRDGSPYYNHIAITYLFERVGEQRYPLVDHASWIGQGAVPPKL